MTEMVIKHAISRKRYWRMSGMPAMRYAMPNKWLEQQGLLSVKHLWGSLPSSSVFSDGFNVTTKSIGNRPTNPVDLFDRRFIRFPYHRQATPQGIR